MDETGIFDILNTSLIFWEVIAFFILLFLLVRYVYPPIREQILERQSQIERAIDESFVAGFRAVMFASTGLALASALVAALMVGDQRFPPTK